MPNPSLVRALARSFVAGEQTVEAAIARATRTLGGEWRWIRNLARGYIRVFANGTRPRHRDVVQFILRNRSFRDAAARNARGLTVAQWLTEENRMQPVAAARAWEIPKIESMGHLAAWLNITDSELLWFADLKGLGYKQRTQPLRHYNYRILTKPSGDIRLIEAPKSRLKALQQIILAEILDKIPPHLAVHGFIKKRSIKTFVAPHVGQRVVLRMDLKDFFPSFPAARIQALFRTVGYPDTVADLLAGICTNATPRDIWHKRSTEFKQLPQWRFWEEARSFYAKPHLPQGAPTSPALANICSYRMDCRLGALANSAGASYTRYADDLAFSGGEKFERSAERFSTYVAAILFEEGFTVNHRKTRIMRQGVRQHLAGIVANQHMNIRRTDFDRLKAILTNCLRKGPASQNREQHPRFREHLEGRVGFTEMINPVKGKRLRAIFEQIQWAE